MPESGNLKAKFRSLYGGIEFPDSLFLLHEFLVENPFRPLWQAYGHAALHPTGVLEVLQRVAAGKTVRTNLPVVLHYRLYRDPPEFFTYLHGDTDGLHWGLLWDEPSRGFRGAASYYNNDGDNIRVYGGAFDALFQWTQGHLETSLEYLEDPQGEAAHYERQIKALEKFREQLAAFVSRHNIATDEERGRGPDSMTGLDLILPQERVGDTTWTADIPDWTEDPAAGKREVREAIRRCEDGNPVWALLLGRTLWHRAGKGRSRDAFDLLRAGYVRLNRPQLVEVLDQHFRHRDLPSVDLFTR